MQVPADGDPLRFASKLFRRVAKIYIYMVKRNINVNPWDPLCPFPD